jgi:hypothetical protein
LPDEGTDGDDRIGKVKERVDDDLTAFITGLEPVADVVPGIRALHVPAAAGLASALSCPCGRHASLGAGQTRTP